MPQLETIHLIYDILILIFVSFSGFLFICYTTCITASYYYNTIAKYIINIHNALSNTMLRKNIIFMAECLNHFYIK